MKVLFCLLGLIAGTKLFCQKTISITGIITEKKTGKPLPFATIGIMGSPHGTISNPDGEFAFFIPDSYLNDTLSVSHVGYESYSEPIKTAIKSNNLSIALTESIILLDEVEVNTEQLTGNEIIQRSLERLENNYASDPFILRGFFRDIRDQNGQAVYLVEASVDIHDQGFSTIGDKPKRFYLNGVRASESRINGLLQGSLLNSGNSMTVNLEYNYWLNKLRDMSRNNQFEIEDIVSRGEITQYVVSTEQLVSKQGLADKYKEMKFRLVHRYHVDTETYAIHKVEHLEYPIEGKYVGIERPYEGDTLFYSKKGWNQIIEFEEYQDKMYLKYHDVSYAFDIVDEKNDRIHLDMAYQFIFIRTEIETVPKKPSGIKMNKNKPLAIQSQDYDGDFWNDPNNTKLVPLTKRQIQGLELEKPLEEQFKAKKSRPKKNSK